MTLERVAHRRAQLLRFARMAGYALAVQLLTSGASWPGWRGLWSLLPGAAETVLRQALPVKPIPERISGAPSAAAPSEPS